MPKANTGRGEVNSLRPVCLGASRLIHLIDHAQPHQRQVWLYYLDHISFGSDDFRQPAGGDDARATAQLSAHPIDQPLHQPRESKDQPGLHRVNGVFADRVRRSREFNLGQLGGKAEQHLGAGVEAGRNRHAQSRLEPRRR